MATVSLSLSPLLLLLLLILLLLLLLLCATRVLASQGHAGARPQARGLCTTPARAPQKDTQV